MVEPLERPLERLPEPGETSSKRSRRRTSPSQLLGLESHSTGIVLFSLLAILYAGTLGFFEPGFAQRPGAIVTHLLLLLGITVVFLGLWDWLALSSLRHLLRRDRRALWRKYGRPYSLRRRLDNSTFEQDAELGGGLVTAALRRFVALGRPEGDFLTRHLCVVLENSRIGTRSLSCTVIAAPLLGLLGALLGLRAGFQNLGPAGSGAEAALASAALGLSISLLAMLPSRMLSGPVAEDCARLLFPVMEATRGADGKGSKAPVAYLDETTFDKRVLAWTKAPWSQELRRYRAASALLGWIVAAALILFGAMTGALPIAG